MNPIAEEILMHYGMPRRSGRYPWGSGENPYQHSGDFLSRIDELKSQGMSDTEIAKAMGLTTTQYRTQKSLAKDERRALDVARAKSLREDGLSLNEIAKEMGFANDSSVRSLLNENSEVRMNQAKTTAEFIKKQIDEKGMIDVGAGVERELGISKEKLNEALYMLEMEGYPVYGGRVDQITNPGKKTTLRVICPPGTEHKEIYDFENINSLKDYVSHDDGETFDPNEVYAPNYKNGETVALVRYPHGGTFEIPVLTVNNKQAEGRKVLGNTPADAIGINKKVADRLSGADFDGDTVMVIPCNSSNSRVKITSTPQLKGLEGFDPKMAYGTVKKGGDYYNESGQKIKIMNNTQTEMGKISNLITDMTLKGATQDELARAVRHSMVVIDAEKHKLDYKKSEQDNGITALKKKYQAHENDDGYGGAATLISRAKSETSVLKRKGSPIIDKETGEQSWKTVREEYVDKNGRTQVRTQKSTKMAETRDARTLSSGTPQEEAYADYANTMKALANQARKEMVSSGKIAYSASAKQTYQAEVDSLMAKLNVALKNAPRERQAQTMANSIVAAKKKDNPDMTKAEIKKANQQALTAARTAVGAKRTPIEITDREWEAIQAGAISENKLTQILNNTNIDTVLWALIYHKVMTSVLLHFYFHYQMVLLESKPETTFLHQL